MGKLKGRRGESDEVESVKENDVICDRVSEDGMKSDGETSDRTEEERPSTQVSWAKSRGVLLTWCPTILEVSC